MLFALLSPSRRTTRTHIKLFFDLSLYAKKREQCMLLSDKGRVYGMTIAFPCSLVCSVALVGAFPIDQWCSWQRSCPFLLTPSTTASGATSGVLKLRTLARNKNKDYFTLLGNNVSLCWHETEIRRPSSTVALNATLFFHSRSEMNLSVAPVLPTQAEDDIIDCWALLKCNKRQQHGIVWKKMRRQLQTAQYLCTNIYGAQVKGK